jgi:hypothetical protein
MGHLETAGFVRDAARLPVPAGPDVPPRLSGDVPDCSGLLTPDARATTAQQWAVWWYRLIRQAAAEGQRSAIPRPVAADPGQEHAAAVRHRFAGRDDVFDPPEFGSLARLQPLQSVVTSILASASAWSRGPAARQARDSRVFAWPVVRDVAEGTAADLRVPIGDITGDAYVLPLEGQWSYLAGPGCALCSAELARDPDAAGRLLRDIFRSGLAGART